MFVLYLGFHRLNHFFFRDSTWEPEKNILDRSLILDYNQRKDRKKIGRRRRSEAENFKPSGSPLYQSFTDDKNNNHMKSISHQKRHFLFDKSNSNSKNEVEHDEKTDVLHDNSLLQDKIPEPIESDTIKLNNDPEYNFFNHLNLRKNTSCDNEGINLHEESKGDQMCHNWLSNARGLHPETRQADNQETGTDIEFGKVSSADNAIDSDQSTIEWVESDFEMDVDEDDLKIDTFNKDDFPSVVATAVTCNSVTVTFFESPTKMGFFECDE